jgi:hypothetical protein
MESTAGDEGKVTPCRVAGPNCRAIKITDFGFEEETPLHTYPAHPSLIRSFDKSPRWVLQKRPGTFDPSKGFGVTLNGSKASGKQRPCAVFEYCGEAMEQRDAMRLIGG